MANLDTRSKRSSSIALFGLLLAPVLPDGAIGQGDRQHIAFSYSGILAAGILTTAFPDKWFRPTEQPILEKNKIVGY